jgi:hypothetical protein
MNGMRSGIALTIMAVKRRESIATNTSNEDLIIDSMVCIADGAGVFRTTTKGPTPKGRRSSRTASVAS